ncbi:penicillin-binding protein 1A [Microbulbifer thermotolerans]|uniref:penicillin-binding protein 1A n=1 Tax=Microbulbifer thermotolerans TaxID=252514 RepID=UPI00224999F8|nr:penicillin-binding protein 1A [Microbulbifer thermotolerans]MCX2782758.1 penicillin-binding protein 1A [Microbulbifer thermotolerans]MCX2831827.1 penicillin-binding protein 1A [Microbulbifer thermotolerans]MCX2835683.1 penicillin-binding protein 1A [Microbulbifer thermotolerans]
MTEKARNRLLSLLWLCLAGAAATAMAFASIYLYLKPGLPSVESLRDIRLQTPLRIYSQDMKLIGEFGEKRRNPITIEQTPELFIKAVLAAEDSGFYSHNGVSIKGLVRAASQLLQTGSIQSGGSTLTMQVARNFFLSREQRFLRKFNEILLSLQIEQELSKDEILELYINKIFLGNRAYGFQAAAHVYYGRDINELNLAQWAMMAGLPKAPSTYNPIANPTRALVRRNWILKRMLELGYIDQDDYKNSITAPVTASYHGRDLDLDAPYVAEMARKKAVELFGDNAYTDGYQIITTVDSRLQDTARKALQRGLEAYDTRHGYRGPEQRLDAALLEDSDLLVDLLNEIPVLGGLEPAVVTAVEPQRLQVQLRDRRVVEIPWENGLDSIRPYLSENARGPRLRSAEEMFAPGDVVRLRRVEIKPEPNSETAKAGNEAGAEDPFEVGDEPASAEQETAQPREEWHLAQVPEAQGALVSLDPEDGAIRALVGGYDFHQSHFNRVTQAARQPGSNFKPFIYASAIEKGYTAASIINDAPIIFEETNLQDVWRPENDSGRFLGPIRLREALYRSRNLVSIRLLQALGIDYALGFVERFGFERSKLARNLTIALGSSALTPLEVARGYATFANGGYRIEPYLVDKVLDVHGQLAYQALPLTVCRNCPEPGSEQLPLEPVDLLEAQLERDVSSTDEEPIELRTLPTAPLDPAGEQARPRAPRAISPQTAYIMDSILKDVIKKGTGRRALVMKRGDIAGKTGTTNGPRDAWFSGYSPYLVTSTWVGFDSNGELGKNEYGGSAALPIWIDFMSAALEGLPERHLPQPDDIVTVRINPKTGLRTSRGGMFEIFRADRIPGRETYSAYQPIYNGDDKDAANDEQQEKALPEELF